MVSSQTQHLDVGLACQANLTLQRPLSGLEYHVLSAGACSPCMAPLFTERDRSSVWMLTSFLVWTALNKTHENVFNDDLISK